MIDDKDRLPPAALTNVELAEAWTYAAHLKKHSTDWEKRYREELDERAGEVGISREVFVKVADDNHTR